jgi:hypothetical protein
VLAELTERVELGRAGVNLSLHLPFSSPGTTNTEGGDHLDFNRYVPLVLKRRGVEHRIVLEGASSSSEIYQPLLKAVGRSRKWTKELMAGQIQSVDELARREKLEDDRCDACSGSGFCRRAS